MTEIFNKSYQKNTRRMLRKMPVGCEKIIWYKIRNKQLGYKFRRQFGIRNYIVDFYCAKLKLVIEIDGATHSTDKEIAYDKKRQEYLESLGLTVVRFNNSDVKENLDEVLNKIIKVCKKLDK